jgi:hypothetical protein
MPRRLAFALSILILSAPALFAQAPPARPREPVTPTTLVDNDQTFIVRVQQAPNSTRSMHGHPDMLWHVFVAMDAPMDLDIQGEGVVHVGPWQSHFFKGGTTHAIVNPNPTAAQFLEFFVKKTTTTATLDEGSARAIALAFAQRQAPGR